MALPLLDLAVGRRALILANRASLLTRLSGGLIHDLRGPLHIITLGLGAVAGARGDALTRVTRTLEEELARLARRVDQFSELLQFSPSDAVGRIDPNRSLQRVAELQHHLGGLVGAELRLELEAGVPGVRGEAVAVEQAMLNLVLNARQAQGTTPGTIRLGSRTVGGEVELWVEDGGPGSPPAIRSAPFTPFQSTRPDGLGLGLCVAQLLVAPWGGRVELLDLAPTGTRAVIRLRVLPA
jgi:two-component system C4-dicarboxylate transport sensor histidine kinase DctB